LISSKKKIVPFVNQLNRYAENYYSDKAPMLVGMSYCPLPKYPWHAMDSISNFYIRLIIICLACNYVTLQLMKEPSLGTKTIAYGINKDRQMKTKAWN